MIRSIGVLCAALFLSAAAYGQMHQPVEKGFSGDSVAKSANPMIGHSGECMPAERMRHREAEGMYPDHSDKYMYGWRNCPGMCYGMPGSGMMFHPLRNHPFLPWLCFLSFIAVFFVINVLLTIIVWIDMARRHLFIGLWIPVLLIAGIPGTALYALFRIGDLVAAGVHQS